MAMDDNKDTRPAKKMKLQEEEIPKSQDGTNTANFEDPQPELKYYVLVELKAVGQVRSSREHPMSLFRRMMKDAGCSESQINEKGYCPYCFLANLTPEEAEKLSNLDSVREVKPYKSVPLVYKANENSRPWSR